MQFANDQLSIQSCLVMVIKIQLPGLDNLAVFYGSLNKILKFSHISLSSRNKLLYVMYKGAIAAHVYDQ